MSTGQDDLVERMARAFCEATGKFKFDDTGGLARARYLRGARAALGAMREPTEAMIVAYREASWFLPEAWRGKATGAWQVMIDAELDASEGELEDDKDKGWR